MHKFINYQATSKRFKSNFSAKSSRRPFCPITASSPVSIVSANGNSVQGALLIIVPTAKSNSYVDMVKHAVWKLFPAGPWLFTRGSGNLLCSVPTPPVTEHQGKGRKGDGRGGNKPCHPRENLEQAGQREKGES